MAVRMQQNIFENKLAFLKSKNFNVIKSILIIKLAVLKELKNILI